MDLLSNLYPINQIGSDGFSWWIGQIESKKESDPKRSGRYRVRIVGIHPEDCAAVPSDALPWATVMMPVTSPHTPGGSTSVSDQLGPGVWCVGFFLDSDKQQPIILGTVGRVANSTKELSQDPTPGQEGCKAFTTYVNPENQIPFDQDLGALESGTVLTPQVAGHPVTGIPTEDTSIESGVSGFTTMKYAPNTNSNPGGNEWCIEIADQCGKETDLTNTFTRLFSEMLAETQRNNGKLGDYLVGEVSGELFDAVGIGRKYVDQGILVMRTFVASVKGFILEKMKAGIKDLINMMLYPNETGNSLTPVTEWFNNLLNQVGCSMADLGDRLASFLEDLIFGYLFNIYKAAACQVDKFVNGVLNKIQSLLNELLDTVLGPLQDILGVAASAINIIGDTLNYVMNLLGISCNGPGKQCSKTTKICVDCDTDDREGFLDKLLKDITDDLFPVTGEDWSQYTCDEAYEGTRLRPTEVVFVGGIQDPPEDTSSAVSYMIDDVFVFEGDIALMKVYRSGDLSIASSVEYFTTDGTATEGLDYKEASGLLGFAPGETEKSIEIRTFADNEREGTEDLFVTIKKATPRNVRAFAQKNIAKCYIRESPITTPGGTTLPEGEVPQSPPPPSFNPDIIPGLISDPDPLVQPEDEDGTVDPTAPPSYDVVADKNQVKEGEFVKFTITTRNVPTGTTLFYRIFGTYITPSDIVEGTLSGAFVIESGQAEVVVGINEDSVVENNEKMVFGIVGTGAQTSVLILSDTEGFSDEERVNQDDSSSNVQVGRDPFVPTVGSIVTNAAGGIIDIPIDEPGDPYVEPPVVIIPGEGYRASALPLLDDTGRIVEIRITDPGFGYKLNTPAKAEKECIIDSFTMLNPGRNYTSAPDVYINGDKNVADAVINTDGQVISVRIKDRSLVFEDYPEVIILGGGGYGARFIPSFTCLDPDTRVEVGSAKIGTGKYIDCP